MRIFIFLIPLFLFASDLIVKYQNLKPFYYKNQIINLNAKVISPYPNLMFVNSPNVKLIVNGINPYIYELNLTFKANETNKTIQIFSNNFIQTIYLNKIIHIKPLPSIKYFSGVIANNLKIINPISSKDKNNTILSFSIKCKNCNIEDFNISDIKTEQQLKVASDNEATYYIILPSSYKKFIFYYYNLKENKFQKIEIPIILKEKTISTQTNINPKENKFLTPLNIFILILIAIGLIIFLIFQKIWLLIFPIILSGAILIQLIPKGEIILKPGTKVQILPTQNSTVFYIVKKTQKAKILNKRGNYIKIKINNKIGWIYESN